MKPGMQGAGGAAMRRALRRARKRRQPTKPRPAVVYKRKWLRGAW